MDNQRVILAHDTRFLRSTLKRLIAKSPRLEVVAEVDQIENLPAQLQATPADWLILSLPENGDLPAAVLEVLQRQPDMRVLAVAGDGSRMRLEWIERRDREIGELSVPEFIALFSMPVNQPANDRSER
jgi:DNA-binding NarL/FixJ family response regulator